jgi:hypothetical protein
VTTDKEAIELAREQLVSVGYHVLGLYQSRCASTALIAALVLALVGWGPEDLAAELDGHPLLEACSGW